MKNKECIMVLLWMAAETDPEEKKWLNKIVVIFS